MARRKPSRSSAASGKDVKPKSSRFWRWIKWITITGFGLALIGAIALGTSVWLAMGNLPGFDELKRSPNGQTIRVHAADGSIIVTLGPTYGRWLRQDEIPQVMSTAMVAVEDRRFYDHLGIDPVGVARSAWFAWENRGTGRRMQGASTITQQLARNIFLSNSYTFSRKMREVVLALAMERKFTKDQILELYLNKVYFGGGSYGIDAASRRFFNHDATTLSLSEAAIIAGLVKAPSRYSPTADSDAAVGRARVVLQVMQDAGVITAAQAASANPVAVKMQSEVAQDSARYFTDWALPQLDMLIDETTEPLDVWTTLDLSLQRSATASIKANVPGGLQGALVSMDRDGAVLAMVGGTDYVTSNYNRATQAVRQPGSAWKLFVYMAALEAGYKVGDMVDDRPVSINGWSPRNASGSYAGEVSLRTAFAYSLNTIAAQIGDDIGYSAIANMARRFGITTPVNTHPSMVLGTSDVRLIDLTRAFAAVSAKGFAVTPYGITKVTTADNRLLYERTEGTKTQLVDPWVAAGITDLLQTAVNTGTGRLAQIGRPVAGKTGTTSSNKDGWFVGFSSGVTTGVWMGRDDARANKSLMGGQAPARAFADYMRTAVAKRPVEEFETEVTLPEWQLEEEGSDVYGEPAEGQFVDDNGMPIEIPSDYPSGDGDEGNTTTTTTTTRREQQLDQNWVDQVIGRNGNEAEPPAPREALPPGGMPPPPAKAPPQPGRAPPPPNSANNDGVVIN